MTRSQARSIALRHAFHVRLTRRACHDRIVRKPHHVEEQRLTPGDRITAEAAQSATIDRIQRNRVADEREQEGTEPFHPARQLATQRLTLLEELTGQHTERADGPVVEIVVLAREQRQVRVCHTACRLSRGVAGALRACEAEDLPQPIEQRARLAALLCTALFEQCPHREQPCEQASDKAAGAIALAIE